MKTNETIYDQASELLYKQRKCRSSLRSSTSSGSLHP